MANTEIKVRKFKFWILNIFDISEYVSGLLIKGVSGDNDFKLISSSV